MAPEQLCEITGLNYCGPNCGCGENSGLLYFPMSDPDAPEDWVPGWMNGATPEEVERWLQENGYAEPQAAGGE